MFKKIYLLFALALALPVTSQARVGGPFDGADYTLLFDDTGVYQAILRMKNGSGMMQFGVNVNLEFTATPTGVGGAAQATTATSKGGVLNRSLIYLEGVTYFGIASGAIDHERGIVEGITNGTSDIAATVTGGGGGAQISVVSNNNRAFSANSEFTAKITDRGPDFKFCGKGEITVLTQTTAAQAAQTAAVTAAQTSVQANTASNFTAANAALLLSAPSLAPIPPATGPSPAQTTAFNTFYNTVYLPGLQTNLATALANQLNNQSAFQSAFDAAGKGNQFSQKMYVYGSRKFFGTTR